MELFIDIETVPDYDVSTHEPKAVHDGILARVQPDARTKDPDKMAEQIAKKKQDLAEDFGLSPLTGKIVCFSLLINAPGIDLKEVTICDENEHHILSKIFEEVRGLNYGRIITFNGNSFDIPFLVARAAIMRQPTPFRLPRRYNDDIYFDVRDKLTNYDKTARGRLEDWAIAFGNTYDGSVDGSAIHGLYVTKQFSIIEAKCRQDVKITREIYESIKDYY